MSRSPPAELEVQVASRLSTGDARGAAELALRGLGPAVLRYLRSLLREEEAAADAFSEFAEDLWLGLPGFRGEASLRTWAFRIAWHAALRVRQDEWRRRTVALSRGPASRLAEDIRTKTPVRNERRARALAALRARLSLDDQSLLVLRVDQGLPWAEVAQVLAAEGNPVEVPALQKRFQRLKDRLAVLAREEGLVER
jgi:RNA polymerase sigma-70 factor, ECF subfamily